MAKHGDEGEEDLDAAVQDERLVNVEESETPAVCGSNIRIKPRHSAAERLSGV